MSIHIITQIASYWKSIRTVVTIENQRPFSGFKAVNPTQYLHAIALTVGRDSHLDTQAR